MSDLTRLLHDWSAGRAGALDELLPLVFDELRAIAERHLQRERSGHTLQPTALVNELYFKLAGQRRVDWSDRAHFFAVAAEVMRRVLIDHARRRNSDKRGGGITPLTISAAADVAVAAELDVVALDEALEKLEAIFPQQAKLVELRFYAGLTIEESAAALGISPATVSREWAFARAWLKRELGSR